MTESPDISNAEACVDCGHCCQIFHLGKVDIGTMTEEALAALPERDRAWIEHDLIEIPPERGEGIFVDFKNYLNRDDVKTFTYRHYDHDTKRCTDYDNRPDICRRFPIVIGPEEKGAYLDCTLWDEQLAEIKSQLKVTDAEAPKES